MERKRFPQQHHAFRKILPKMNNEVSQLTIQLRECRAKLASTEEQLEQVEHEQGMREQAHTAEIIELKEALALEEFTSQLATQTLHKKQKSFEKRKKLHEDLQKALKGSRRRVAELEMQQESFGKEIIELQQKIKEREFQDAVSIRESADLRRDVSQHKKTLQRMKAQEAQKAEEIKKKIVDKIRLCKEWRLKEIADLKAELKDARRMQGAASSAESQKKNELTVKLEAAQNELKITQEELAITKSRLEMKQHDVQHAALELAEKNADLGRKNEEIRELKKKNMEVVYNAKAIMGKAIVEFGALVNSMYDD